jgi:hypothetical protein
LKCFADCVELQCSQVIVLLHRAVLGAGMNRLTVKVIIAVMTFTIGAFAAMSWFFIKRNLVKELSSHPLPYCEVARNPERYNGKIIRVRATLSFGSDGMYVVEDCDPISALSSLVELEGSEGRSLKAGNYVNEMLTDQTEFQIKKIDTIIVGQFDGEYSRGCWAPKYRIAATNIEKVSR